MAHPQIDLGPDALETLCRKHGIHRLAIFCSAARGELNTPGLLSPQHRDRVVAEAISPYEAA